VNQPPHQPPSARAFDQVAPNYDSTATDLLVSRWLRAQVWRRLAKLFQPGSHVLELGCGTGEDAIWLAGQGLLVTATDASPAMLAAAQAKAEKAGLAHRIRFGLLDLAAPNTWQDSPVLDGPFAGVYSNYGALNCVGDWAALAPALAARLADNGQLALGVMGRFCLWETLWHGGHGHWRTASRRWRGQGQAHIGDTHFSVYYPSARGLALALRPHFKATRYRALGLFLPPSDLYAGLAKHRRLANGLHRLEQLTAGWPGAHCLADHFWLELRKA
jgi:SAM-dependent methyltransferase